MAVQFKVADGKILADIVFSQQFQTVVEIFKKHHNFFNASQKSWIISPSSFQAICEELEDIEPIVITEYTQQEIDKILEPPSNVKFERVPFTLDELRVPPFQGKPPYENYQLEDIQKCVNRNRWALFNEQGLGKSYEIISALNILNKRGKIGKILFLTSDSGVYNIKREFERFSDFDSSRIAIGGKNNREPFSADIDIVICNYRSFLLISDHYHKLKTSKKSTTYRKSAIPFDTWLLSSNGALVLDESQKVANPKARQTKALDMIKDSFEYRYLMSGTPYDKEEKIYSQMNLLDPALVHNLSYFDWLSRYAELGNRFSAFAINYFKKEKKEELTKVVSSICSRRFSDECLDLPEHLIKTIVVPFEPKQELIYKEIIVQKLKALQALNSGLRSQDVVNAFPYLILGIDNPKILLNHRGQDIIPESLIKKVESFNFEKDHSKVEALLDLIELHPEEKIVIWTSHPSVGFELQKLLEKHDPLIINGEVAIPKGKTLDEYKGDIVYEFEHNPKKKILIAGIQVLSTAVTMVAANVQIVFDTTFSFIDYSQALKRIHRIGQSKTVYTYVILIDNSLDMLRFKVLEDKGFLNAKFLTDEYIDKIHTKELFSFTF